MSKPIQKKLIERLSSFLPEDDFQAVIAAFGSERYASFRVNDAKSTAAEVESILLKKGVRYEPVAELPGAYLVPKSDEYSLKGSDAFYQWKIYVQGLSSQIPVRFLDVRPGARVLDVCAAPGSKTTQIAAALGGSGEVVAIELSTIRMDKLLHNAKLQGVADVVVPVRADAIEYLTGDTAGTFDRILLDAMCSAEGRIRLDDERSYGFWTLLNVEKKAALQSAFLQSSLRLLAPGGILVYSTCTLAPEENERVVSDALAAFPDLSLEECRTGLAEDRPGLSSFEGKPFHPEIGKTLRLLPSSRMEGFYVAKFRRAA